MLCTTLLDISDDSAWILVLLLAVPLYFLPSIIAKARKNSNTTGIFVLNLFLGWTFLCWIAALIWAFSSGSKQAPTVVVHNTSQSYSQEYKAENFQPKLQMQPEVSSTKLLTQQDKIDHLRQLKQLLDEGVFTNEEFNSQKAAVLGQ
jgi:ABC-type glycerol-3-phosphate transport system permease component